MRFLNLVHCDILSVSNSIIFGRAQNSSTILRTPNLRRKWLSVYPFNFNHEVADESGVRRPTLDRRVKLQLHWPVVAYLQLLNRMLQVQKKSLNFVPIFT